MCGDQDSRFGAPILVGGEHRSGTTLLATILDSHPHVTFGLELDFLEPANLGPHVLECCTLLRAGERACWQRGTPQAEFHWGVQFVRQCVSLGLRPDDIEALVRETMRETGSDLSDFADRCALVHSLGEARRREPGVRRWGFKIQRNIMKARDFAAIWPDAHFVHVVRDGRDVAASHLRDHRDWGYQDIAAAAAGWCELMEATRRLVGGPHICELKYEELVRWPREALSGLLRFLGLPWDDAVLCHSQTRHGFTTVFGADHPSVAAAGGPINDLAVNRYRRDLGREEIGAYEQIAGPWLKVLGYAAEAET